MKKIAICVGIGLYILFLVGCPSPVTQTTTTTTTTIGTGKISIVAGGGTNGYSGDSGAATLAELELYGPSGVAVDSGGNLFLADTNNNVIRKVTPAGIISTYAGNGTLGYSGDGGVATSAKLYGPLICRVTSTAIANSSWLRPCRI